MSATRVTFSHHIDELRKEIQEVAQASREAEAEEVARDAASRARRGETGEYAAGFKTESDPSKHEVWVYNDAPDAPYNEYGTTNRPATPALGPATHAAEPRWPGRLAGALRGLVGRYGGG